jgi:ArsR family transcriptional regulator
MKLKETQALFTALADETRLRILNLLAEGELCVCDLMKVLGEPQSKVSRHLAYLRRTKLVSARRRGLWMHYRISGSDARMLEPVLRVIKDRRSEIDELDRDLRKFRQQKGCLVACCE